MEPLLNLVFLCLPLRQSKCEQKNRASILDNMGYLPTAPGYFSISLLHLPPARCSLRSISLFIIVVIPLSCFPRVTKFLRNAVQVFPFCGYNIFILDIMSKDSFKHCRFRKVHVNGVVNAPTLWLTHERVSSSQWGHSCCIHALYAVVSCQISCD